MSDRSHRGFVDPQSERTRAHQYKHFIRWLADGNSKVRAFTPADDWLLESGAALVIEDQVLAEHDAAGDSEFQFVGTNGPVGEPLSAPTYSLGLLRFQNDVLIIDSGATAGGNEAYLLEH